MQVNRKFVEGKEEVDVFLDLCSQVSVDVIELLLTTVQENSEGNVVIGIDYPKIRQLKGSNITSSIDYDIVWIDGELRFYPDINNRAWGYLADTKNNREFLAQSISKNKYRIVDSKIRKEIEKLAEDNGYNKVVEDAGEYVTKPTIDPQIEELKKKLKLLEEENKKLSGVTTEIVADEKVEEKPPLKGTHIKKIKKPGKISSYAN